MNDQQLFSTEGFLYRLVPDGAEVVYAPMQDYRIVIPSHLEGHPVVSLARDYHDDLYMPSNAAEIFLPETLLHLPGRSFCAGRQVRCTMDDRNPHFTQADQLIYRQLADGTKELVFVPDGAEAIVLPHDVSRIGENAFAYSTVQRVTFSDSVKEIAAGAFRSSELVEIDLPAVRTIGDYAFAQTCLQSVLLPATLVSMADTAFAHCAFLQEIQLDEANEALQAQNSMILSASGNRLLAWPSARACEELILPKTIHEIGKALAGSTGIKKLRICGPLDALCEGSLHLHCPQIVFEQDPLRVHPQAIQPQRDSIQLHISKFSALPATLAESNIEYHYTDADEAFLQALEQYRLGYENGGYTLLGCRDWQERVQIPETIGEIPVLRIGANAFSEKVNGLYPTEIVIPEGVVELKQAAFFWLAQTVRQIELPASIQVISDGLFEDASGRYRDMFLHEEIAFLTVAGSPADNFLRSYRRAEGDLRGEELIVISHEKETLENESEAMNAEPDAVEWEPEASETEPATIEAEPEAVETEPVTIEAEPEAVETEPATIEAEPEAVETEPATTEAEPEALETEPATTEAEPEALETEPTTTEAEPEALESEPAVTEAEPEALESEPAVTETEPETVVPEPMVTVTEPEIPKVEPMSAKTEPGPEIESETVGIVLPLASETAANNADWKIARKKGLVIRYLGQDTQLVYPLEADGVTITGIADCDHQKKPKNHREITSVVLPEGYTCIGDSAFEGFSALVSVTLPSTLRTIGSHAFDGCTSLRSLELPRSVMHVGKSAFKGSGLKQLIVHNKKLKLKKNVLKKAAKATIYAPRGAKIFQKSLSKRAKLLSELDN